MAEIENIHCPICTQPIPSSWQNALPPALATLEQGDEFSCIDPVRIEMVPINEMFYFTTIFDALVYCVTTSFMGKR